MTNSKEQTLRVKKENLNRKIIFEVTKLNPNKILHDEAQSLTKINQKIFTFHMAALTPDQKGYFRKKYFR